jgi:hypothetical protein
MKEKKKKLAHFSFPTCLHFKYLESRVAHYVGKKVFTITQVLHTKRGIMVHIRRRSKDSRS